MKSYLKIKVLSLGAEISLIRREERRHLRHARFCRVAMKGVHPNWAPEQMAYADKNFWGLREHRLKLRGEARSANIAYAYLRGRTYAQVERSCYSKPNLGAVLKLIERYGEGVNIDLDILMRWVSAPRDTKPSP